MARPALVWAARRYAGWKIHIGRISAKWFPPRIRIANLTVANPEGFAEGTALVLRELYVERGGKRLEPGETVLRELRVDIERIALQRLANGETNFDRLLALLESPPSNEATWAGARSSPTTPVERPVLPPQEAIHPITPPREATGERSIEDTDRRPQPMPPPRIPSSPPRTWRIERLVVRLGEIELSDELSAAGTRTMTLNRTLIFTNVTDFAPVATQLGAALTVFAVPQMMEEMLRTLGE